MGEPAFCLAGPYIYAFDGQTWRYETSVGGAALLIDESAHVYGVTVDPRHTNRVFITDFEGDVMRSDNRGMTWRRLGGFNFMMPKNPIVDPYDKRMIYVTTFGGGLWHGPQEGVPGFREDVVPFH